MVFFKTTLKRQYTPFVLQTLRPLESLS